MNRSIGTAIGIVLALSVGGGCGGSSGSSTSGTGGSGGSSGSTGGGGTGGSTSSGATGGTSASTGSAGSGATGGTGGTGGMTGGGGTGGSTTTGSGMDVKRVFVSSDMHNGALGGLDGGDAKCQALADKAALGGTWRAWLGDGKVGPKDHLAHSAVPYMVVGGPQIAANWDDLVDGKLTEPIDHDENGATLDMNAPLGVKTGAGPDGTTLPMHCLGWTSESGTDYSATGKATDIGTTWSQEGGHPCAALDRLYCFEQ